MSIKGLRMKKIELKIQCRSCGGTGIYVGIGERDGAAIVCHTCNGTGCEDYYFEYTPFTKRKKKEGIKRVYKDGMGYCIAPKLLVFKGVGTIDMAKEGVSYAEFLEGKMPEHIKTLGCPMQADQGTCHEIKGFIEECDKLNGGYLNMIADCKNHPNKAECWDRFDKQK